MSDVEVVDGGDRACGELLLVLTARARTLPPGSVIRLFATDPAAAVDLPAWCHLTRHRFLGRALHTDGRPYYDVTTSATYRETDPGQPWRLTDHTPSTREELRT